MTTTELTKFFEEKYRESIENFDMITWQYVSKCRKPPLTEDFIKANLNNINWYYLCLHQDLSETFISKHISDCTEDILRFQILTGKFIYNYPGKHHQYGYDALSFDEKLYKCSRGNALRYLKYLLKKKIIAPADYLREILGLRP